MHHRCLQYRQCDTRGQCLPVDVAPMQLSAAPLGDHDDLHCIVLTEGDVLQSLVCVPAALTFSRLFFLFFLSSFVRLWLFVQIGDGCTLSHAAGASS